MLCLEHGRKYQMLEADLVKIAIEASSFGLVAWLTLQGSNPKKVRELAGT